MPNFEFRISIFPFPFSSSWQPVVTAAEEGEEAEVAKNLQLLADLGLDMAKCEESNVAPGFSPASLLSRGAHKVKGTIAGTMLERHFLVHNDINGVEGGAMQIRKTTDRRDVPRYGVEEAARCLGMSPATLDSWVNGRKYPTSTGTKFFKPLVELAAPGKLSFYNLVEAHILLSTRRKHKVEIPSIRRGIDYVSKTYPSDHPLLTESFLTDGKDLFIKKIESLNGREQTINVSSWGQLGLGHILDFYLRRIERDEKGWPIKLYPIRVNWPGDLSGDPPKVVVIDPAVSTGRPVVNGTGVMAEIIVGRFNTGEGIGSIAEDYGLQPSQVEEVIRYAPAA